MRAFKLLVLSLALLHVTDTVAQEFFGKFKDPLKGQFIDTPPRPHFKLESDFRFVDPNGLLWETPSGTEVDGASIPQPFWSLIGGPFEGEYIKASVIHDRYCTTKSRTTHDTHRNFYYGMRANGVPQWKAKLMYWVVDAFGPKWELTQRVVQEMKCNGSGTFTTFSCNQVSVVRRLPTLVSAVDLADPGTLAAALTKTSAVARTLKTTDGAYLDVSATGTTPADLESISRSATTYRSIFSTGSFKVAPEKLGILSSWESSADQVSSWKDNLLPPYSAVKPLTSQSISLLKSDEYFRLTPASKDLLRENFDFRILKSQTTMKR